MKRERCGGTVAYECIGGTRVFTVDQMGRRVYSAKCLGCWRTWKDRGNSRECSTLVVLPPPDPPVALEVAPAMTESEAALAKIQGALLACGYCHEADGHVTVPVTPKEAADIVCGWAAERVRAARED